MTVKLGAENDKVCDKIVAQLKELLKFCEDNNVKSLAIENLSLIMVASQKVFQEYLDFFIKTIENERPEPKKSREVGFMLKTLFDCAIVHSLFVKKIKSDTTDDTKILRLRTLLMKQLRDADYNIKSLATEGFCRMLICESSDKSREFIARLILLLFEKVPTIPSAQTEIIVGKA